MLLGAFFMPAVVCGTAFFINFIAIYYHASRAIPFTTMVSWYFSSTFHHYTNGAGSIRELWGAESMNLMMNIHDRPTEHEVQIILCEYG